MPLHTHPPRDVAILLTGLSLLALAAWIDRRDLKPVYSPYSGDYEGEEINPFDRLGYTVRDERAGWLADAGLYGGPTLPLLFSFDRATRPYYPLILLLWLQTLLLTFAFTSLIKNLANRPRPYIYSADWHPQRRLTRKDRAAFLSGHAANATAGAVLFALLLETYERPLSRYGRILAVAVAGATAFLRVKAGKHWPTDAAAGVLLGGAVAGAVIREHRRPPA